MIEEKNWYESTTIWGALLAVASSLAAITGVNIDPASQNQLAEIMVQLTGAIGALVAVYGRLTATEVIS